MKKKLLSLLLILPLLAGCPAKTAEDDVETMPADYVPNLPDYKDKKSGEIKSDGDYVYFDFYEVSDFHGAVNRSDKEVGLGSDEGLEFIGGRGRVISAPLDTESNDGDGAEDEDELKEPCEGNDDGTEVDRCFSANSLTGPIFSTASKIPFSNCENISSWICLFVRASDIIRRHVSTSCLHLLRFARQRATAASSAEQSACSQ